MRCWRINLWLLLLSLAFIGLGAGTTRAQEPAAPPLEDLLTQALAHSPQLAAARARIEAAREQAAPAGALTDPMLEFGWQEGFMPKGSPVFGQATAEFRQELPFPGKRGAREKAAAAETGIRAAELHRAERQLIAQLRGLYARLYAIDRERSYLGVARELLAMIAATASTRYSVGEGDQEALLKAQLALSRLMERQDELVAERQGLVAELNRLLDRPGEQTLGEVKDLPEVATPFSPSEDTLKETPDVAMQRSAVDAAELRIAAAKKEAYPDFIAGLGGGARQNDATGKVMPMAMLTFGITLPIWQNSKQQPLIRAAHHELEAARQQQREAAAAMRAEAARQLAQYLKSERQIRLYQQAIVPQTQATLDAARSSYLAGRGDFSTVIEDFNLWLEARAELARREAERFTAWAALEALRPVAAENKNQGEQP